MNARGREGGGGGEGGAYKATIRSAVRKPPPRFFDCVHLRVEGREGEVGDVGEKMGKSRELLLVLLLLFLIPSTKK